MAWVFPHRAEAQQRLEAALSEHALAGVALTQAKDDAAEHSVRSAMEAERITADARARIDRQAARRERRQRAELTRGVVPVIEDALLLPSFGGSGKDEG